METILVILLALAIYIGIPALIGFAILGAVILPQRIRKARKLETKPAEAKLVESKAETRPAEKEHEPVVAGKK